MYYSSVENFKSACGYDIDGIWYPRVTSIVSIKAKPGLYRFYGGLPSFEAGEQMKTKSAAEGTLMHDTVEQILLGNSIAIPPEIKPAIDELMKFLDKYKITTLQTEELLVSKRHRYAGTMDAFAEIFGKQGVLDIKTSYAIFRDYGIQTAAYVEALEEQGHRDLTRWILRIDQHKPCLKCNARLREKGGFSKVRGGSQTCLHEFGPVKGDVELKELHNLGHDVKAFLASKDLWEWENAYWLKQIGY
jgi:hypothetical protein